jgi:DNA-binding NarL/FixJ family response regulator
MSGVNRSIRVVVADDHAIVRAGIRALLSCEPDISIVAEATDGRGAVAAVQRHAPDVLLVDLSMPGANGVEAIAQVHAHTPSTHVLVLSMHAAPEYVRPALRAGALGYVVKGAGLEELVTAVRTVAAGGSFLDASIAALASAVPPAKEPEDSLDPYDRLTHREREVLQLVAEGRSNRQIGEALGLSPKTIDSHRTNLMRKLELHDAQAVTRFAVRRGLVSPD